MIPLHFANPAALLLLLALPLLFAFYRYGDGRRRAALAIWRGVAASTPPSPLLKRALQAAGIAAIALALAGPTMQPPATPPAKAYGAADIVFLIDVSRSMLATDVQPTRLARAKALVRQLAAQDRGNRVALVAFAGGQSVACPLTVDHAFFDEMLDDVSPDSVPRGGTRIGDAIRFALERVFDNVPRDRRTLVVLSDGEDHESQPEAAAAAAARAKVHLLTVGIGEEAGALVPVSATDSTPFLYRGEPVRSRLTSATMRAIAGDGGVFLAGNQAIDAAAIYRRWLVAAGQGSAVSAEGGDAVWLTLVALAIALLAIEPRIRARGAMAVLLAAMLVVRPFTAEAQTIEEWFNKGLDSLDKREYTEALHYFSDAARWAPDIAEIRFNLAKSLYGFQSYAEAALSFEHAARIATDTHLKALAKLGEGNSLFRDATAPSSRAAYAIPRLRSAIDAYRAALKIEPGIFAADINLKVAERRLRDFQRRAPDPPPPDIPGAPPPPPPSPATADQILRESRHAAAPRALARGAGVDKDW